MAVRVKVRRLGLIARLEAVRDDAKAQHAKALEKYQREQPAARKKLADELRAKADKLESDTGTLIENTTIYNRNNRGVPALVIESRLPVPQAPAPHRGLRDIARTIALLDASEDEMVSISDQDMGYYGIGSLAGLEDD